LLFWKAGIINLKRKQKNKENMKKTFLITMLALVSIGTECFAEGKPFAPYKSSPPYTALQASEIASKDCFIAKSYAVLIQQVAEMDGWIKHYEGKIKPENAILLLQNCYDTVDSWETGEVIVSSRVYRNSGDDVSKNFFRPSYSNREKKEYGPEPVFVLDITALTGWLDDNGNPYPKRVIGSRYCINTIFDTRCNIFPTRLVASLETNEQSGGYDTTLYYAQRDSVFSEEKPTVNINVEVVCDNCHSDGEYCYLAPCFVPAMMLVTCFPFGPVYSYSAPPPRMENDYFINNYYEAPRPRIPHDEGHGIDPVPEPDNGHGIDPAPEPGNGNGIDPAPVPTYGNSVVASNTKSRAINPAETVTRSSSVVTSKKTNAINPAETVTRSSSVVTSKKTNAINPAEKVTRNSQLTSSRTTYSYNRSNSKPQSAVRQSTQASSNQRQSANNQQPAKKSVERSNERSDTKRSYGEPGNQQQTRTASNDYDRSSYGQRNNRAQRQSPSYKSSSSTQRSYSSKPFYGQRNNMASRQSGSSSRMSSSSSRSTSHSSGRSSGGGYARSK